MSSRASYAARIGARCSVWRCWPAARRCTAAGSLTPEGRHVFLEVNPAGEFFWLERENGFPISDALADVLLDRAPRREPPQLAHDPRGGTSS